jgi:transcriptional regulator with XRE-family HTH domain
MKDLSSTFGRAFAAAEQQDEYWTELAIAEFTEEVVRWMEVRGFTGADLAAALGASPPYVSKVLRGNANFTLATMTKLARALGAVLRLHLAPRESHTYWRAWDVISTADTELNLRGTREIQPAQVTARADVAEALSVVTW